MMRALLRSFVDDAFRRNGISAQDVEHLRQIVLKDGLSSRLEAETLLALDRLPEKDGSWGSALTSLIVRFVVWGRDPAGAVEAGDALWLVTALDMGGPSETAMAIAYGILDEASRVDGALLDFIMRGRQQERMQREAA